MIIPIRHTPKIVTNSRCSDNKNVLRTATQFRVIENAFVAPRVIVLEDMPNAFASERSFVQYCDKQPGLRRNRLKPDGTHQNERDIAIYAPHPVAVPDRVAELQWKHRAYERTKEEFLAAQAAGEILTNPMSVGHFQVRDKLVIKGLPADGFEHFALYYPSQDPREYVDGCNSSLKNPYRYPWFEEGQVAQDASNGTPEQNYSHLDKDTVHYRWAPDAELSTLFAEVGEPDLQALQIYFNTLGPSSNLHNTALDELHGGLYDLGTEILELKESIGWAFSILKRMLNVFMAVRKREIAVRRTHAGSAMELSRELSSAWMEYRYAMTPLLKSFEDWQEYYFTDARAFVTVRKREDIPFDFTFGEYHFTGTAETRVWAKGSFDTNMTYNGMRVNPMKSLWEITPYAFLVGWILPIGTWLGALLPPTDATQRKLMHSVRVRDIEVTTRYGSVPMNCDYYRIIDKPPSIAWGLTPDISINWKRKLDALSLSWLMATTALEIK